MNLRSIPSDMDTSKVARIDGLLDRVTREQGVYLPLAVESGSRAWGFPSPDSDYDCRFIFVRPVAQHLTLWPPRDVIEIDMSDDLDANGWDLAKALRLLLKGNAVVVEWLRSPVVYRGHGWFREELLALANTFATREAIGRHYLHLGEHQRRTYFNNSASVAQKKIFYALRPAATLRWLRLRPSEAIAPMHFPTLMAECAPPPELAAEVSDLMRRKAVTRELGSAPLTPGIANFIDAEFRLAREVFESGRAPEADEAVAEATNFYRTTVQRLAAVR